MSVSVLLSEATVTGLAATLTLISYWKSGNTRSTRWKRHKKLVLCVKWPAHNWLTLLEFTKYLHKIYYWVPSSCVLSCIADPLEWTRTDCENKTFWGMLAEHNTSGMFTVLLTVDFIFINNFKIKCWKLTILNVPFHILHNTHYGTSLYFATDCQSIR